jgi:hypothetical protein
MINDNLNISSIETYLDKIVKGKVSKSVYAGTLPNTIEDDVNDLVLIDCGNAISDLNAYGKGTVNVFLYAKPTANGRKNVAQLSKMEKAMNKVIDNSADDRYMLAPLYRMSDYDSALNWHYIIVALNLIIR